MRNYFFGFIGIIIFFIVGISVINQTPENLPPENISDIKYVKIAGQKIKVELAISPEAQTRGLSGRSALRAGEGMLFAYQEPGRYAFWMKDMNFPIDIIWISEENKIVYIKKDARPELFPETYSAGVPSRYVLEVPAGFSDKSNLKIGDGVEFVY